MSDTEQAGTLLNLAVVARMMLADGHVAPEEAEILEGLMDASGLDDEARARVGRWSGQAPDDVALRELAAGVDDEGRSDALALSWVVAMADADIHDEEVGTFVEIAELLGLKEHQAAIREAVEGSFFGSTLSVLAALASMAHTGDEDSDTPAKLAHFGEVLHDVELPEPYAEEARQTLLQPRPLQFVLGEASGLDPDFQEALLGNLWAMAWADGKVDDRERALFSRFENACGVPHERVLQLQVEWGPGA